MPAKKTRSEENANLIPKVLVGLVIICVSLPSLQVSLPTLTGTHGYPLLLASKASCRFSLVHSHWLSQGASPTGPQYSVTDTHIPTISTPSPPMFSSIYIFLIIFHIGLNFSGVITLPHWAGGDLDYL